MGNKENKGREGAKRKNRDPATEESQNPNSRLEPEIEDSVSKALGLSTGQTPSIPKQQKKVQVGAAVKQAIQIANAELKTNLQQPRRDLKRGAATVQKKNVAQPTGRSITATLTAKNLDRSQLPSTLTLAKGEEGKKNRDKKAMVKCDKAISFAEFCAEMGDKVDLQILECSEQVIHCMVVCKYEIRDFQQCCSKLGLVDTGYSGAHLTWTNNSTWSKLDRVMINNRWIADGLRAHAHFGFLGKLSDHSPSLVSLFEHRIQGMQPFKFFNMWTLREDFQRIVSMVRDNKVYGSAMFRLCRKLKFLKEPLKELNKKHFSRITSRATAAEADLYEIQQKLHDNTSDPLLQEQMVKMKQTAFNLAEAERSYCSQLAKMKYLKNSDRGSKFFHDLIKIHRNKGQIVSITLPNGSRSKSQQEVNESFVEFYKNLLGSSSSCTPIDRNVLLEGSIGDDKAPGPDGYSALFFKRAWNIIGKDFCEAIKEFFSSSQILKQMNHSCVSTTAYSISINGSMHGFFKGMTWRLSSPYLDFSEGRFPFRYLGLPVASTKLTIAQFHPFTDRIAGYLNAWAVCTSLLGLEIGSSGCVGTSFGEVNVMFSKRLWLHGNLYAFQKWKEDWGFKNLEAWNLALLSKNLWNIQAKKDSLWVRWIHLNHLQNSSIWDYNGRKQDSAMLRQVLSIRDKICELERSMQAVGTRMEQWVLDGRFCSKSSWLGISRSMGTLKAAVKWIFKEARGTGIQAKAKRIGLACTVYYIWEARNERIFEDIIKDPKDIIRRIQIQDIAVVAHGVGVGVGIGVSVGVDGGLYLGQVSTAVARGDAHVVDASVPPVQFQLLVAEIGSGSVLKTGATSSLALLLL
ncbi:hypothetical protein Acr_29g0000120 [Actinidia rufa]|uniref:Uncharacterized protein n=1 Tax=Actinidia rufa TaxID=165716 RepID=A0A7J0HCJ5_9ERIC|nr:hypothetical protein Acr_29g0000120 [Actinidia rufa]